MKALTEAEVRRYQDLGYHFPVPVMDPADALSLRRRLEDFEASAGRLAGKMRQKPHLLFTWLNDLIRHPRILDAVEDIIGPDILCWGTSFFIKEPRTRSFVSWHQDLTYWGLEPPDVITAWVALSDATAENGAMRVIPASHKLDQVPHNDTFRPENLLSRGQEIMVDVNEAEAVMMPLQAGEMSLHHVRLIHGSDPNPSGSVGSASRSATCPRMCARWRGRMTARPWCGAWTGMGISSRRSARMPTCRNRRWRIMPRSPGRMRRS